MVLNLCQSLQMKKIFFLLVAIFSLSLANAQQRYAFVDTEYILKNIPEYQAAKEQLNKLSKSFQTEIEGIYEEVSELEKKYRSDRVFLSTEMREKREKDIAEKQFNARQLQEAYFGRNGELFNKRKELIKPIQEKIYNAIKKIATSSNYAMVLDQATTPIILYANSKYDMSDKVLEMLGYSAK